MKYHPPRRTPRETQRVGPGPEVNYLIWNWRMTLSRGKKRSSAFPRARPDGVRRRASEKHGEKGGSVLNSWYLEIWGFPKIELPPNHPIAFSIITHPAIGVPPFMETFI